MVIRASAGGALIECRECKLTKPLAQRGLCSSCYDAVRDAERRGERGCELCGEAPVVRAGKCVACLQCNGGTCSECGKSARALFRGRRCSRCYGLHSCANCPERVPRWKERCAACARSLRAEAGLWLDVAALEEFLGGDVVLARLLAHWKAQGEVDRVIYRWARRNEDLLRAIVGIELSHEVLNRLPFSYKVITGLRLHLENAGVLEPLVLNVDLFMGRVSELLAGAAAADVVLLKEYARLYIVPLAQRRLQYGERVDPRFKKHGEVLRYLKRCSFDLASTSRSLATLDQADYDRLFAAATYNAREVLRTFVKWLNRRRPKVARIVIRRMQARPQKKVRLGRDELAAHIARANGGSDLAAVDRIGVLLTALYGQPGSAIAALHVSQLSPDLDKIRFGDVWLDLPEPLPALMREALDARAERDKASPWVFPSPDLRGRPLSRHWLHQRFVRIGFPAGAARGAGLVNMLRTIEYPLLARLFGISMHAASSWAALVDSPSWDRYVALRHVQDRQQPTTVTIADRVYAEYRGEELAGELGPTSPAPARAPLPDEAFETEFAIRRVRVA